MAGMFTAITRPAACLQGLFKVAEDGKVSSCVYMGETASEVEGEEAPTATLVDSWAAGTVGLAALFKHMGVELAQQIEANAPQTTEVSIAAEAETEESAAAEAETEESAAAAAQSTEPSAEAAEEAAEEAEDKQDE